MPKRTNDFQVLILKIYEQLADSQTSVTESAEVWDKDGENLREVDILIEHNNMGHNYTCMVECRDRSRKETIEWIDGLIGKAGPLKVDKIVAISSKGFAKAALKKAAANNIDTITLEKSLEVDWPKSLSGHRFIVSGDKFEYLIADVQLFDVDGNQIPFTDEIASKWSIRLRGCSELAQFKKVLQMEFTNIIDNPEIRKSLDESAKARAEQYSAFIASKKQAALFHRTIRAFPKRWRLYGADRIKLPFILGHVEYTVAITTQLWEIDQERYFFNGNFVFVADIKSLDDDHRRVVTVYDSNENFQGIKVIKAMDDF